MNYHKTSKLFKLHNRLAKCLSQTANRSFVLFIHRSGGIKPLSTSRTGAQTTAGKEPLSGKGSPCPLSPQKTDGLVHVTLVAKQNEKDHKKKMRVIEVGLTSVINPGRWGVAWEVGGWEADRWSRSCHTCGHASRMRRIIRRR